MAESTDREPSFVHPAVEEALEYGDQSLVYEAPRVIETLGRALYDTSITSGDGREEKIRQAIKLLQEVVKGE